MIAARTNESTEKNKFSILLSSILLLSIGNKIYEIVLPLLVYDLTRSSVSMTTMRTAELLPNFFFAIFIGVAVDRVNRKNWALWMVGLQAILLVLFAYLFKTDVTSLAIYSIIGFLLMTFNYGFFNVQVSLLKQTVPASQLTQANAKVSFVETFVSIMGPALSGLLFLFADMSDGLLMTALLFGLCLILLFRLPDGEPAGDGVRGSFVQELREGWSAFTANRVLFGITMFVMLTNCSVTVVQTGVVFFGKDVLQLSSPALALALSAAGIGGLLGSVVVSPLRKRIGLGKVYGLSVLIHTAACCLLAFPASVPGFVSALLLIGFAVTLHGVSVYTLRHEQTPARLIGRMAGITGTIFRIGMPVTMYASGWVMASWGTAAIFAGAAIWNAVLLGVFMKSRLWKQA